MPELHCVVQSYAWGKLGGESFVAQLKAGGDPAFQVDPESKYAEFWMGTHPNGPSRVMRDGKPAELLEDWLKILTMCDASLHFDEQAHPEAMGSTPGDLPFLFKVLSVQKALSIQAHPDVKLARQLHATKPELYKDANHKPEMAIALTRFEALSQFRTISEIAENLGAVPELRALVDEDVVQQFIAKQDDASLRAFFKSFIYTDTETVALQLKHLRTRLQKRLQEDANALTPVEALVLRLYEEYRDDIGCFCPYILNYLTLQPGEAVYLGANEPHAYLSGDCIECMACSDNVVRAGLTPKFIDKVTLHQMLTYRTGPPAIFSGDKIDEMARMYTAPVPEFQVEAIEIASYQHYALRTIDAPSVVLVISGSANGTCSGEEDATPFKLVKGSVFFVPAGQELDLRCGSDAITAFRAAPNEQVRR